MRVVYTGLGAEQHNPGCTSEASVYPLLWGISLPFKNIFLFVKILNSIFINNNTFFLFYEFNFLLHSTKYSTKKKISDTLIEINFNEKKYN